MAVDISPTSSNWPDLCGASIAYGLTSGGYNAQNISLTELGRRVVAPTIEGDDLKAKVEASLLPEIPNKFFNQYNKAKFPQDKIAKNVIAQMGVTSDRIDNVLKILKLNSEFVGIIHQTKTGPFIAIDTPIIKEAEGIAEQEAISESTILDTAIPVQTTPVSPKNQKVFITHGKNKEIVNQLKDLLTFGKFIPVVAQENTPLPIVKTEN
jgi:hypothetical protein